LQIAKFAAMDGNHIGKPQRQIRQVIGKDFLYFTAKKLPLIAVHFHTNLIGESVEAWVAVVSAICAIGWKSF